MPTSHLHQLNEIMEVITLTDPHTLLDVGVGFGKYGVLAREYLDIHQGFGPRSTWRRQIDGLEGFAAYVTPVHDYVYDHLYVGEALDILPSLESQYDLVLLIDILEHFEREQGLRLLGTVQRLAANLLISTPKAFLAQGAAFGNRLERHRSHWGRGDFADFADCCFIPNDISLICFMGRDVGKIRAGMFSVRRQIKRQLPFVVSLYRLAKSVWAGRMPGGGDDDWPDGDR